VNAKQIAQVLEVLMPGETGGEGGPEPLNRRFNWKDPLTKKSPPRIPRGALPTKKTFSDIDREAAMPPGQGAVAGPGDMSGPEAQDMTDRVGKHSMNSLLPPEEMATIDQLLDRYLEMQKTHGPEAASQWFNNYRSAEFESILKKIADFLLG
jgi:hypothetical protein